MKKSLLTGCLISALWLTGASSAMAATSGTSTVNITVPSVTALYVENYGASIDFTFGTPDVGDDFLDMTASRCTNLRWTNNAGLKKITVSADYLPPGATLSFSIPDFLSVDGVLVPAFLNSTTRSTDLVQLIGNFGNSVANYDVTITAEASIRAGIAAGTHTTTLTYTIENW